MHPPIEPKLITKQPVAVWLLTIHSQSGTHTPPFDWTNLIFKIDRALLSCSFRGTNFARLPVVLQSGIDVEPTDAHFFVVNSFDKAWEYGAWPKLVLALETKELKRTFVEVPADMPPPEVAKLREQFPTMVRNIDGSRLWLSRLPDDDYRLAKPYETDYARWIDGNPFRALAAVLLFARPQEVSLVQRTIATLCAI